MLSMRRMTRNVYIAAILLLSVFAGYILSDFQISRPIRQEAVSKEALTTYREAKNFTKTEMNFVVNNLKVVADKLELIYNIEGVRKKFEDKKHDGLVAMIEVPEELRRQINSELKSIEGLKNEKTESSFDVRYESVDSESHIEQNKMILKRLRERLTYQNLTTREINELEGSIREIQTKIDSLNSIQSVQKARMNQLILIEATQYSKPNATNQIKKYGNLIKWTVISMISLSVFALILYFAFYLLTKLAKAVGIKSAKSSSRYGYSYGQYGYGRSSKRKRKVVKKEDKENDTNKK